VSCGSACFAETNRPASSGQRAASPACRSRTRKVERPRRLQSALPIRRSARAARSRCRRLDGRTPACRVTRRLPLRRAEEHGRGDAQAGRELAGGARRALPRHERDRLRLQRPRRLRDGRAPLGVRRSRHGPLVLVWVRRGDPGARPGRAFGEPRNRGAFVFSNSRIDHGLPAVLPA
jgi:hypothetical protein